MLELDSMARNRISPPSKGFSPEPSPQPQHPQSQHPKPQHPEPKQFGTQFGDKPLTTEPPTKSPFPKSHFTRRHFIRGLLTALAALPFIPALWAKNATGLENSNGSNPSNHRHPPNKAQASKFFTTTKAEGIYFHRGYNQLPSQANGADISSITLIVGDDAAVLVDTGYSFALGKKALEATAQITPKPIRWVINTHVHPDHIFGNGALVGKAMGNVASKGAGEIQFCGHRNLPRLMAEGGIHYTRRLGEILGEAAAIRSPLVPPAVLVTKGEPLRLDLGNRSLVLEAYQNAHTATDLTVFDEKTATLIAGDLVFDKHLPTLDGSMLGWLEVLKRLKQRDLQLLIPGHGIPRQDWRAQITKIEEYLQVLEVDVRGFIQKGVPISEAATLGAASQRNHWLLFDAYNPRNVAKAYAELEWA